MNALYLWTNGDTVITLADTLELEGYGVGLIEMHGKIVISGIPNNDPLYLCSDISQDTYVRNIKLPVLREIKRNGNGLVINDLCKTIWLKVTRQSISKIRLYICDVLGNVVSFDKKKLYCTLLFIPDRSKC